jgi:hypothetical protein
MNIGDEVVTCAFVALVGHVLLLTKMQYTISECCAYDRRTPKKHVSSQYTPGLLRLLCVRWAVALVQRPTLGYRLLVVFLAR